MPRMSRPSLLALALAAASAAAGCDLGTALAAVGHPSFRELEAGEGRAVAARDDVLLVQARGEGQPAHRVRGARMLAPEEPLAEALGASRILIVSEQPELGFRLAARLSRAGATGVMVVSGGLPAWDEKTREE